LAERFQLAGAEAEIIADALVNAPRRERRILLARIGSDQKLRLRLYDSGGRLSADSFELAGPAFRLIDPDTEPWYQHAARALDRGMDFVLGAPPIPAYLDPESRDAANWPEIGEALAAKGTVIRNRLAPDRTPVITAAVPVGDSGEVLMTTRN